MPHGSYPAPQAFIVAPLTAAEFHAAYPLVRAVAPRVTLTEWLRFARRATRSSRSQWEGVTTARHEGRRHPCGLCCWRRDVDLEAGQVLTAEHIIAMDLLDPAAVIDALAVGLEHLARRLGCSSVRSVLHTRMRGRWRIGCGRAAISRRRPCSRSRWTVPRRAEPAATHWSRQQRAEVGLATPPPDVAWCAMT